jgi:hypothetical protein
LLRVERKSENPTGREALQILKNPSHGNFEERGKGEIYYSPKANYSGNDQASVLVQFAGRQYKVLYRFKVRNGHGSAETVCGNRYVWKIS